MNIREIGFKLLAETRKIIGSNVMTHKNSVKRQCVRSRFNRKIVDADEHKIGIQG